MSLFLSVMNVNLRHIGLSSQLLTPLSDLFSFFFCDLTDVTLSVIEYWQFQAHRVILSASNSFINPLIIYIPRWTSFVAHFPAREESQESYCSIQYKRWWRMVKIPAFKNLTVLFCICCVYFHKEYLINMFIQILFDFWYYWEVHVYRLSTLDFLKLGYAPQKAHLNEVALLATLDWLGQPGRL